MKGGVSMDAVLSVLKEFDRMPNNKNFPDKCFVERSLDLYGYLTLFVFVRPDTRGKFLLTTDKRERFMPTEEPNNGLLFARIPKLKSLTTKLWQLGVPSKIIFAVADNSYELYRGPIEGIVLDTVLMDERRKLYAANLTKRLARDFPQLMEVFSLGLNRVGLFSEDLVIPEDVLAQEIAFQREFVYSQFYDKQSPTDSIIEQIVRGKCRAYEEQGLLIEAADAILIGTEGADELESWRQRTIMLKLGGAKFPVVYPYIRKENLSTGRE